MNFIIETFQALEVFGFELEIWPNAAFIKLIDSLSFKK